MGRLLRLLLMMLLHLLLLWLVLGHLLWLLLLLLHLLRRTATSGTDLVVQLLQDVKLVLLDAAGATITTSLLVLLAREQRHELGLLLEIHAILALQWWLLIHLLLLRWHVASSIECRLLTR